MKLVRTSNNTFYRTADGQETYSREYEVGEKTARDIEDLANEYGQTDDVLRLYDDSDKLIAMAMWPQTGGGYRYCYGKYLSENPAWCVWRSSSKSSKHAESEILSDIVGRLMGGVIKHHLRTQIDFVLLQMHYSKSSSKKILM